MYHEKVRQPTSGRLFADGLQLARLPLRRPLSRILGQVAGHLSVATAILLILWQICGCGNPGFYSRLRLVLAVPVGVVPAPLLVHPLSRIGFLKIIASSQ